MSDVWGANPDELDALAGRLAASAGRIDELRVASRADLSAAAWQGRDAEQFRSRWEADGVRCLSSAAALLRGAGSKGDMRASINQGPAAADGQRNVWFGVTTGLHPAAEVPEPS